MGLDKKQVSQIKAGVAIQGYEGSFHQVAAKRYFGDGVQVIPCATFRDVIRIAKDKTISSGGVMAIENSIAGSILPNYTLLQNTDKLKITGEIYLPIQQHLLANPGVKLEEIHEVHSHHMAIQQCMEYLGEQHWKLVETEDTALSAKHLHERKSKHIAAVASKLAAELFQLEIIAADIHTQKNNYTRFLILKRNDEVGDLSDANKASINFITDHTKGSLAKVLLQISDGGVNLSKLQSMPIAGTNFKYSFHADLEFDALEQLNKVLLLIKSFTEEIKVFGVYRRDEVESKISSLKSEDGGIG